MHPSQIGFMPGSRTTDHTLILKTLHDKYVNQHKNGKIYACFVAFKKAFDSVWHEGLLLKLLHNKIGGTFYDLYVIATLSVYPHRASLKNMPGHGGIRTYDLWMLAQCSAN